MTKMSLYFRTEWYEHLRAPGIRGCVFEMRSIETAKIRHAKRLQRVGSEPRELLWFGNPVTAAVVAATPAAPAAPAAATSPTSSSTSSSSIAPAPPAPRSLLRGIFPVRLARDVRCPTAEGKKQLQRKEKSELLRNVGVHPITAVAAAAAAAAAAPALLVAPISTTAAPAFLVSSFLRLASYMDNR